MTEQGNFKNLSPEEIKHLKGQIAAILNYTAAGDWPENVKKKIRKKLTNEQIDNLKAKLDQVLL